MPIECGATKIDHFQRPTIILDHNILRLEITMDQIGVFERNKAFENLAQVLSDVFQW